MDSSAAAAAVVSVIHGSSNCLESRFKRVSSIPVLPLEKSAKIAHVKSPTRIR